MSLPDVSVSNRTPTLVIGRFQFLVCLYSSAVSLYHQNFEVKFLGGCVMHRNIFNYWDTLQAYCHRRSLSSTGHCAFRAQDGGRILYLRMDRHPCLWLFSPIEGWSIILFRCCNDWKRLVFCEHGQLQLQHSIFSQSLNPFVQLAAIIFFVAFVQMFYYLGVMQWLLEKLFVAPVVIQAQTYSRFKSAWLFFKLLNVSGAEAVVAASSPWIGQGESACLVRPYVDCACFVHFSSRIRLYICTFSDDRIWTP